MFYIKDFCSACYSFQNDLKTIHQFDDVFLKHFSKFYKNIPNESKLIANRTKMICENCYKIIYEYSNFYTKCMRNQTLFIEYLSQFDIYGNAQGNIDVQLNDTGPVTYNIMKTEAVDTEYIENCSPVQISLENINDSKLNSCSHSNTNGLTETRYESTVLNNIKVEPLDIDIDESVTDNIKMESIDDSTLQTIDNTNTEESALSGIHSEEKYENFCKIETQSENVQDHSNNIAFTTVEIVEDERLKQYKEEGPPNIKFETIDNSSQSIEKTKTELSEELEESFLQSQQHTETSHTDVKSYSCEECGKNFTHSSNLNRHRRIHTGDKPFPCDQCDKKFTESSSFIKHKRVHTGDQPYSCEQCGKKFSRSSNLIRHIKIHTGDRPYSCDQCNKKFDRFVDLLRHTKTHTGDKPYSCEQCGKKFIQLIHLIRHKRNHKDVKLYLCEQYSKISGQSLSFNNNASIIQPRVKRFSCDQCGSKFTQSSSLISHKRIHAGIKPFSCEQCGKKFTQSAHLSRHRRTHTGEKPYSCELCGMKFTESSKLTNHKKVHTGDNIYPCDQCDKQFTNPSSLSSHKGFHAEVKPYSCDQCGSSFTRSSSLANHKNIHAGIKPYSCEDCGKKFTQSSDLITHKRIHTGDKPYSCEQCNKKFTSSSNLSRHKRIHTADLVDSVVINLSD